MRIFVVLTSVTAALARTPLTINTPDNPIKCTHYSVTWKGGVAPFTLTLLPADPNSSTPPHIFPELRRSPYSWDVTEDAGCPYIFQLQDGHNVTVTSGIFYIQDLCSNFGPTISAT